MADVSASMAANPPASNGLVPNSSGQRLSFASVAALAASQPSESSPGFVQVDDGHVTANGDDAVHDVLSNRVQDGRTEALRESVARLNIMDKPGPIIASADADTDGQTPISERVRYDDEKTHLSFISNPTVSTDVRSVVSGTTFAMDEKESIRPDESASVKAADEDESASGGTSGGPQSLAGSEAGKAFRDQYFEISGAKKALPLTTNLVQQMPDESGRRPSSAAAIACEFPPPDEKLLEALHGQRDRVFLLQLEQQFISFVKNPKEEVLRLPPNNAFCRLLAHRLADYYNLSHAAEGNSSVTIGKTDSPRLPTSLSEIARDQIPTRPVVQQAPALKIMRRSEKTDGSMKRETMPQKSNSAPASPEAGSQQYNNGASQGPSAKEASPSKDSKRPTLEEREAIYNARREQLYRDVPDKKSGDDSAAASRASSTLGGPKTKKKMPKNDDFEPRSAFMSMNYPNTQPQGYSYSTRPAPQMYAYPHGGAAAHPDQFSHNFAQMSLGQQGYNPTDSNQAFGAVYSQPMQAPPYFDASYGYGLQQQTGVNPQYMQPMHGGQPAQPYPSNPYDPVFVGYVPVQGHPQMMQPNVAYPAPAGFGQPVHQQGQFTGPPQGQYAYPMQQSGQGMMQGPVGAPMYMQVNESNTGAFSNASHPMFNPNTSMHASSGVANAGMQLQPAHLQAGISGASRPRTPTAGFQMPAPSNTLPWHSANRGQGRESNRTDENVPHRYGYGQAGYQSKASGQLNKYDKSSLPPKPPAPASSGLQN